MVSEEVDNDGIEYMLYGNSAPTVAVTSPDEPQSIATLYEGLVRDTLEGYIVENSSPTWLTEFYSRLPHTRLCDGSNCTLNTWDLNEARRMGEPFTENFKDTILLFWDQRNKKQRFLGHLRKNPIIREFIDDNIDATVCVGLLRSMASKIGHDAIMVLASDVLEQSSNHTRASIVDMKRATKISKYTQKNSRFDKPYTLHPNLDPNNKITQVLCNNRSTQCFFLDWKRTLSHVDVSATKSVAAITNLICAILSPILASEVVKLGKNEEDLLNNSNNKSSSGCPFDISSMCLVACVQSLIQYFTGCKEACNPYCAPFRLSVFEKHPVIDVSGSPFFCETNTPYVCSLNQPVASRMGRNRKSERKLSQLFKLKNGIVARVVTFTGEKLNSSDDDPHISTTAKERGLLVKSILMLSGTHGWFNLTVGHTTTPDVLYMVDGHDNVMFNTKQHRLLSMMSSQAPPPPTKKRRILPSSDLSPMEIVNQYSYCDKTTDEIRRQPRVPTIDMRFDEFEVIDYFTNQKEYTCNTDIRTAFPLNIRQLKTTHGNCNAFWTRPNTPTWYSPDALSDQFGSIEFQEHVKALDDTVSLFEPLVDHGKSESNRVEKLGVFTKCECKLISRLFMLNKILTEKHGINSQPNEPETDQFLFSQMIRSYKKRQLCCSEIKMYGPLDVSVNDLEELLNDKSHTNKTVEYLNALYTDSESCVAVTQRTRTLLRIVVNVKRDCNECYNRFLYGECRIEANELLRFIYRISARLAVKNGHIKGMKWTTLWFRPIDTGANTRLSGISRNKLVTLYQNKMLNNLPLIFTRDTNPMPIRHKLLSIVFGEAFACDVSALSCLEWLTWSRQNDNKVSVDHKPLSSTTITTATNTTTIATTTATTTTTTTNNTSTGTVVAFVNEAQLQTPTGHFNKEVLAELYSRVRERNVNIGIKAGRISKDDILSVAITSLQSAIFGDNVASFHYRTIK